VAQIKQLKVKRPATGYLLFVTDFMKKNGKKYRTVQQAISDGACVARSILKFFGAFISVA